MTMVLETPVTGPVAWRNADVANDPSWIHHLDAEDLDELEAAAAAVQQRATPHLEFGRDDFALPTLGPKLADMLDAVENGRGFVLIRGLPVPRYDRATLETIYWGLGSHLGNPISQNAKGQRLAEVKDRGHDYHAVNARGYTTNAGLNPHVDTSDMTALLCFHPAKEGGLSSLASSATIYNEILANHPEYLEVLYRGFRHDLRGEGVTGDLNEVTHNRIPVYSYFQGRLSCSYNLKIIETASSKMDTPLTDLERKALDYVADTARRPDIRLDMDLRQGDIQFINNYTLLHYRAAFVDFPEPERKRNMLRLWVNFHDGRPLAPEFADRYNTGPRGGVAVGRGNGFAI